jgi:hypothetical protein
MLFALVLAATAPRLAPADAGAQGAEPLSGTLTVSVSESDISLLTGDSLTFTSEIANNGTEITPSLVANLNFVSINNDVYVDPEDWSPDRTVIVDPILPGSSSTQSWTVNPVLKGEIGVYVAVLPRTDVAGAGPLAASPAIHLSVGERRSLNPGGVLPAVLGVPALLALAFAGIRLARRPR